MITLSACGAPATQKVQTSLNDLLAGNTSQKCTATYDKANGQVNGTVYVMADKMHVDITSTAQGKETQSHIIILKKIAYLWLDGMTNGLEVPTAKLAAATRSGAPDMSTKMSATCGAWPEDDSQFVLPSTVTFREIPTR